MSDRPLITFALFAYNQEQFIREAVEGAFAQTYSPLEIILSDDCSSDRTYEIMQEMVATYRGPHKIILNRNVPNLGLIGHVNKVCFEIAQGEFIVVAAGDDISLPERVLSTHEIFKSDNNVVSVTMDVHCIDRNGNNIKTRKQFNEGFFTINDYTNFKLYPILGCARGYKKNVFTDFGPLAPWCGVEDDTLNFRSFLLGRLYHTEQVGVKYRIIQESFSRSLTVRHILNINKQKKRDLKKYFSAGKIDIDDYNIINKTINISVKKGFIRNRWINRDYSITFFFSCILFSKYFSVDEKKLYAKIILSKIKFIKFIINYCRKIINNK